MQKSHFESAGLFDENLLLTQDYDLLFRVFRGQKTLFVKKSLLCSRIHGQSGKSNDKFNLECSEQYLHFANSLSYNEIKDMGVSPRALYFRLLSMAKSRTPNFSIKEFVEKIENSPSENNNAKQLVLQLFGGSVRKNICIFGSGFHGKILKYELNARNIDVKYFCDNNEDKFNTVIDGISCISPAELHKNTVRPCRLVGSDDLLTSSSEPAIVIVALDMSDLVESQLKNLGIKHIFTKKNLDTLILDCQPTNLQEVK
ncbi:hypothetical protein AGMMS49938_15730 [Fibrobacterales bacterium]|nr:hypothetical protein AGMMS49938_15730 [Fibrobacterales bacterium]